MGNQVDKRYVESSWNRTHCVECGEIAAYAGTRRVYALGRMKSMILARCFDMMI